MDNKVSISLQAQFSGVDPFCTQEALAAGVRLIESSNRARCMVLTQLMEIRGPKDHTHEDPRFWLQSPTPGRFQIWFRGLWCRWKPVPLPALCPLWGGPTQQEQLHL